MATSGFPKSERLYKKKDIEELFEKGSSFYLHPCKVLFIPQSSAGKNRILVSVSKRNFGKAVDRNRIKRQIREAWRLNKHLLGPEKSFTIAYIYSAKEKISTPFLMERMHKIIKKLKEWSPDANSPSSTGLGGG
ncbi:MAG: ribonuclease P protein component [Flammeovirgaceae bacterium]|nr:ribonuclease P protein component [Flammeovirgaceae bacterium]